MCKCWVFLVARLFVITYISICMQRLKAFFNNSITCMNEALDVRYIFSSEIYLRYHEKN